MMAEKGRRVDPGMQSFVTWLLGLQAMEWKRKTKPEEPKLVQLASPTDSLLGSYRGKRTA